LRGPRGHIEFFLFFFLERWWRGGGEVVRAELLPLSFLQAISSLHIPFSHPSLRAVIANSPSSHHPELRSAWQLLQRKWEALWVCGVKEQSLCSKSPPFFKADGRGDRCYDKSLS
jgi:hypothetical protein